MVKIILIGRCCRISFDTIDINLKTETSLFEWVWTDTLNEINSIIKKLINNEPILINRFNDRDVMADTNIITFHYLNKNEKFEIRTGSTFKAAEDFVCRYANVPVAGFNYYSFCKKNYKVPPYILNTRIYSCLLIDNNANYRWRGRYNEDTDLSLRVLKDGLCTIQFNAFLCGKITTQRMRGGNSAEFYDDEGTLPKSQMLAELHPDIAKVVFKFNRWHHHVDYSKFKKNRLIKIINTDLMPKINNYGMQLV
jgi:hypothetical protein